MPTSLGEGKRNLCYILLVMKELGKYILVFVGRPTNMWEWDMAVFKWVQVQSRSPDMPSRHKLEGYSSEGAPQASGNKPSSTEVGRYPEAFPAVVSSKNLTQPNHIPQHG